MKAQIKLHHDSLLKGTTKAHKDHKDHTPLTDNQVNGIQMNLKQLKSPNRSYYEFMDPTNGTFFLVYNRTKNPFAHHDFTKPIANPTVRKMAETNSVYLKKFKPKVWTKKEKRKNSSRDMHWPLGGEILSPSLLPTSK